MSSNTLKPEKVLKDFLDAREWTDELQIDPENRSVRLFTKLRIGEYQDADLFIDAVDETSMYGVFFYFPFQCKESQYAEMCVMLNMINCLNDNSDLGGGNFEVLGDGKIRYVNIVYFVDGVEPTGHFIERMFAAGWDLGEYWAEPIASVALTRASGKETFEAFLQAELDENNNDAEGPTEL